MFLNIVSKCKRSESKLLKTFNYLWKIPKLSKNEHAGEIEY